MLVRSPGDVQFGCELAAEACAAADVCAATDACAATEATCTEPPVTEGSLRVDREDFCVTFDPARRQWTVS